MVRKLSLAVAIALGTTSMSALGLGLGDIKSQSVLNQTLNADIRLLSVGRGDLDGLRVKLAPAEAFERAGVNRAYYLSQIKFTPQKRGGHHVIHVSTDFPIREPFLNFLVEVNWPKGRLVREYTLLLDPPTTTGRRAPQVAVTRSSQAQATTAPVAATTRARDANRVSSYGGGQYGPVKANDTLWTITEQVKHNGVDHMQMMMSMFKANSSAFVDDNVNNLRKGKILRIPDRDEVLSLSRSEARAMWRAQKAAWLAERAPMRSGTAKIPKTPKAPSSVDDLPLAVTRPVRPEPEAPKVDGGEPDAVQPEAVEPEGQLRIAAPRPEGEGLAGVGETEKASPAIAELSEKLIMARENAESTRIEATQLRQRVEELHEQLRDMQRLLTLKDDQLAQLQQGLTGADGFEDFAGTEGEPASVDSMPEMTSSVEEPVVPSPDLEPLGESELVVDGADGEELNIGEAVDDTAEQGLVGQTEIAVVDEPGEAVAVETEQEGGLPAWLNGIKEKLTGLGGVPLIATIIAGVVALGALFGVFLASRRRKAAEAAFDQEFDGLSRGDFDAADATADTSMLSELSAGEGDSLQQDTADVDPISEADVYIAYGRYQQAEQLLRQSMEKEPERLALPHKLLEVYYATRKPAAFVGLADQMTSDGRDKKDAAAWDRVKEMGRELAPDNAMFAAVSGAATVASFAQAAQARDQNQAPTSGEEAPGDESLGLSELASGLSMDVDSAAADGDSSLDLTRELEGLTRDLEIGAADEDSIPLDELESLDLDLPDTRAAENANLDDGVIPFQGANTGRDETDADKVSSADDLQSELEELSDLASFEINLPDDESLGDLNEPTPLHDIVMDIDDDRQEEELKLDANQESLFAEEDVATKLELARAYVDMGDEEGARSILAEVQEEGSVEQKGKAKELLQMIGT